MDNKQLITMIVAGVITTFAVEWLRQQQSKPAPVQATSASHWIFQ